jgi:mRNA-binding protein PUF3
MDINAGLNKLQLIDGGFPAQPGVQRSGYLSQGSYDTSLQRLKYQNAGDESNYQAVSGYAGDSSADVPLGYAPRTRVGEGDQISPSEYSRMASPFYPGVADAAGVPHYRNASGSRLSENQAAALERKLRGMQQEQDFVQQPGNPLQRLQFPQSYDLANYQAARLNALSGFYPVAHLGGIGAPSMVSRPHREQDPTQVVRSPLLEEFRANSKGNKRYELKVRTPNAHFLLS